MRNNSKDIEVRKASPATGPGCLDRGIRFNISPIEGNSFTDKTFRSTQTQAIDDPLGDLILIGSYVQSCNYAVPFSTRSGVHVNMMVLDFGPPRV
jgi:hypothetical protein